MGLFGFGKKKQPQMPVDEGERYYRQALDQPVRREELLEKSAALGNRHGKAALAKYYWEHYASDGDKMRRAAALLDEAEAGGALLDSAMAGRVYFKAGRKDAAAKHLLDCAKKGDVWAQFYTGWNYANGVGLEKNNAQAAYWYERAADSGDAAAANNLAVLLSSGEGVPRDDARAFALLEQAAKGGDQTARGNLAWKCYHGIAPCPQDDEKAAQYAWGGVDSKNDTCRKRCRYVIAMLGAESRGGVRERWDNVLYALRRLADEGFAPAKEGLERLNRMEQERTTGLYQKALEAGDLKMMDQAAQNGCFEAELYLLENAAKRLEAGETLTQRELTNCMVWYRLTLERGQVPRQVLWPILDAVGELGYRMLSRKDCRDSFYLVRDTPRLHHALCQYVYAYAFYVNDASLATELREVEDGIAHCKAFLENPEAPKLKKYAEMKDAMERCLFFLGLHRASLMDGGE